MVSHNIFTRPPRKYLVRFDKLAIESNNTFVRFAIRYLDEKVRDTQSPSTLEAKTRDLVGFIVWFVERYGHGHIDAWRSRDTQDYLESKKYEGHATTTVHRTFSTLRVFAAWVHELSGGLFEANGLPTHGVHIIAISKPPCGRVARPHVHRLFEAARALVRKETRRNASPRRNLAVLALLYYARLSVPELVALRREQYQKSYLTDVYPAGKRLYLSVKCRRLLDAYLATERQREDPNNCTKGLILPGRGGRFMTRQLVYLVLRHIEKESTSIDEGLR